MKVTKDNVVKYLYKTKRAAYAVARQKKAIGLTGPNQTCGLLTIVLPDGEERYAYKKWDDYVILKNGIEIPVWWFPLNGFGLHGQCLHGIMDRLPS